MAPLKVLPATVRPPLVAGHVRVWLHELPHHHDHAQAHQLLSQILSAYLGCRPDAVPLRRPPGQAPFLENHPSLTLSLSYAGNLVALSCCKGDAHGIDLVRTADVSDWQMVAPVFFAPATVARLGRTPIHRQGHAFALCWSELEARSKCLQKPLQEYARERDEALYQPSVHCTMASGVPDGYLLAVATHSSRERTSELAAIC